jgi:uncharacterized protein
MAKIGQAQDEAMEAILASIRSMMSDEDSPARAPAASAPPTQLPNNVSKLFSENVSPARAETVVDSAGRDMGPARPAIEGDFVRPSQEFVSGAPDAAVERAMTRAMEQARAEVERAGTALADERARLEEPRRLAAARPEPELAPPDAVTRDDASETGAPPSELPHERPSGPSLLSPAADAAVAGAFNQLAASMLSGGGRTIDDLVEDLLRPMLRDWLDDNLPPLVERLVREEIERVSRGRR